MKGEGLREGKDGGGYIEGMEQKRRYQENLGDGNGEKPRRGEKRKRGGKEREGKI